MSEFLNVICTECGEPIANGEGYIHCDMGQAIRESNRYREWKKTHPGIVTAGELMAAVPDDAKWMAHHGRCNPGHTHMCYGWDVERCRTWRELLDWCAHLIEKNWVVEATNLTDLMRHLYLFEVES